MKQPKEFEWLTGLMFNILNSDDEWEKEYEKETGLSAVLGEIEKANNEKTDI